MVVDVSAGQRSLRSLHERAVHTRFTATTDKAPRQRGGLLGAALRAAVPGYALHRCRNAITLILIDARLSSCLTRGRWKSTDA